MRGEKINQLLIAQSLSNTFAKNYENQIILSGVTAKMSGMFFETLYSSVCRLFVDYYECNYE